MDNQAQYAEQYTYEPPHDVLELPSKGVFYKNKKSSVKVAYLTAADENILTSPNLLQSGKVIDVLLEKKILDRTMRSTDLLSGDRNAILFFLRATGYGANYTVSLTDPQTKKPFDYVFDLSSLPAKEIGVEPDQNGEINFLLPTSKKNVKFRYLTQGEEDKLIKDDEARRKKLGPNAVSEVLTNRIGLQVMEVDGDRDKAKIQQFVNELRVADSRALRNFIEQHEPGLDLNVDVEAPSGATFSVEIPITLGFLWPDAEL